MSLLNQTNFLPGLYRPAGRAANRRLEIARHADGTDALGWILLGFLLGAGAAVATMMHAELAHRSAASPISVQPRPAYIAPSPARPPLAGPLPMMGPRIPPAARPLLASPPRPSAASATATATAGRVAPTRSPAPAAVDEQVAEDAAAAGMTSRRGAPAKAAGDQGLY